ncbi:MAG: hypothetical protein JWQ35_295 [Bacteriovoracaceae bacterium]|nr:hypothetical protein [Bacteriovoracaceae bacterium]
MSFKGFLFAFFAISFSSNLECRSAECEEYLGTIGAVVSKYYSHVKIRFGSGGIPSNPVGSKAFAYWRERTPSWIPDTAFAFNYLKKGEVRDAIAMQSAVAAEAEATLNKIVTSDSEKTEPSEWTIASVKNIDAQFLSTTDMIGRWTQKVSEKNASPDDQIELGKSEYVYIEGVPDHPFIFFNEGNGMTHQRARNLISSANPNSKVIFSGSISFKAKKFPDGSFSIVHLNLGNGAWLKDHFVKSEDSLGPMLIAVKKSFNIDRHARVQLLADWGNSYGEDERSFDATMNLAPIVFNDEMRRLGLLTSAQIIQLPYNEELKAKLTQRGHKGPSVGYIAFKRPDLNMEMIFFPKSSERLHQYAFNLISKQYPGTLLLFGGSLSFVFESSAIPEFQFVSIDDDGFLKEPALHGVQSLRALLDRLRNELNVFDDAHLAISGMEWRQLEQFKGHTLHKIASSELNQLLKPKPGPARDAIITIDEITGEFHINRESTAYKEWRLLVPSAASDTSFPFQILSETEIETAHEKQNTNIERIAIAKVEKNIKFSDLTSGNLSIKIPEGLKDAVHPIKDIFKNITLEAEDKSTLKYTIFHINNEFLILAWDPTGSNHGYVIRQLVEANPELRVLWGDIVHVGYKMRIDGSGKLASITVREYGGEMLLFQDAVEGYLESSNWRSIFYTENGVNAVSMLTHQILQGFEPFMDAETLVKQE